MRAASQFPQRRPLLQKIAAPKKPIQLMWNRLLIPIVQPIQVAMVREAMRGPAH